MDLRVTLRTLAKQPAFCLAAILTLALGIGANTAIFSVFDAVILRPLPYPDPGRLVFVWQKRPDGRENGVAGVDYQEWVKQSRSFERLEGWIPQFYNAGAGDQIVQAPGGRVSAGFLPALGAQPVLGRGFTKDDAKIGSPHVVLVSYGLWQSLLGGERRVLGRAVQLNGVPYTLIGVLPRGFDFAEQGIQVWTPLIFEREAEAHANKMAVLGRMKPSVSLEQANREMEVVSKRLELLFPSDNQGWSAMVKPLQDYVGGKVRPALTALLVGVGFVLLIACTNVSNLVLARAEARYKEVAIRAVLGASRFRLIRQLLAETMILAVAGSLAGLGLAWAGLRLLVTIAAGQLPRVEGAGLDARVLGFTLAVTILTGLLFGLLPARQLLGGDFQIALRESGRGSINTRRGRNLRNLLVVSEVALSLMLAIGAILMARSVLWLQNQSRGFSPQHLLSFRVSLTGPDLKSSTQMAAYFDRLLERIGEIPGAKAVGATINPPLEGSRQVGLFFTPEGSTPLDTSNRPSASVNLINPGYFAASGVPIVQGRPFDSRDREDAQPVAIISSALARRFFAGQNPVGRTLEMANLGRGSGDVAREIVGVAGDIRYLTKLPQDSVEIYVPYGQATWPTVYIFVRTDGDPTRLAPAVRTALQQSPWHQPISNIKSVQEWIDTLNGKARLNSLLAAIFAVIALALAAVGIYGVISYSVASRSKEIGIRMAMGATPNNILRWIVRQAMFLAAAGIAIGLAGHVALLRVLRTLLYGVSPSDVSTWMGAAALLGLIAVLASYIPARRAMRSDPVTALRAE
ncbi:MAG TPA: ABC transporter permease [Bryobacteraceae bacterium]|jgi:putative ABC transport system permease protein|nr:ABC transporter permease [Bryobacteraceae bacterium]